MPRNKKNNPQVGICKRTLALLVTLYKNLKDKRKTYLAINVGLR